MLKLRTGILMLLAVLCMPAIKAQRATDLIINEVMTDNQTNFIDNHGERGSWIEIYNTSAGEVNIAGCYLTTDKDNLKMYPIVKGDVRTKIEPHQRVVFYCLGKEDRSVFHTNFTLRPGAENYIALVSANGKDIIDEVTVPALATDQSWGAKEDGKKELRQVLEHASPDAPNYIYLGATRVERFKLNDPYGVSMAITAMSVVFCALLCLFICFKIIGKIAVALTSARTRKATGMTKAEVKEAAPVSGEVYAAIAMALQMHDDDAHDYEDTIITIKRVEKRYSPWSSKLYGLRETPRR
jgi:Na+-transporting methylmalonyl-CoA/oxaloacetate decarboxylase gamma subunit